MSYQTGTSALKTQKDDKNKITLLFFSVYFSGEDRYNIDSGGERNQEI